MSIEVMNRVWRYSSLKGAERLALLALADCANDESECWPSLSTVAKKVNCGIPRVCKILADIERAGELQRQRSSGGCNKRTRYKITIAENTITGDTVPGNTITEHKRTVSPGGDAINHHRTVNNSARRKRARPEESEPRVKPLLAAFTEKYLAQTGSAYVVTQGKDPALLKRLLAAGHDVPVIVAAMDSYFSSEFYSRRGFDIGGFSRAFNTLNSAGSKKRHNYEDGAFPALSS